MKLHISNFCAKPITINQVNFPKKPFGSIRDYVRIGDIKGENNNANKYICIRNIHVYRQTNERSRQNVGKFDTNLAQYYIK